MVAKAELIPQPKSLSQRATQPKTQPKSAAVVKNGANGAKGAAKGPAGKRVRRRSARPAKKTQAELDTEMADYFNAGAAETGGDAPAANGDAQMDDEVE
jgi:THO complex subunit 4